MEAYTTLIRICSLSCFKLILPILVTFSYGLSAQERTYTQKEFDAQIDRIKNTSISTLTKEVLEKERKLEELEERLKLREEQIQKAEKELAQKVRVFELEQKRIIGCVEENDRKESMRVNQLVEVIANMRPQKAAELLEVQDSHIAVKIMAKIDPSKASRIFNVMDKEVSARLQKQYLNMRQ